MLRPLILVVEGNPTLRMSSVTTLQTAGFDVIDVATADSALGILESRDDIRVVFTDIYTRGDLNGLRLGHLVRKLWPSIGLVITSNQKPLSAELPSKSLFLLKPYEGGNLVHLLRSFRLWHPVD